MKVLRAVSALFALLFSFAAVVQLNDPDPALWVLAYGAAAVLAGLFAAGRALLIPNAIAALAFAAGFMILAPSLPDAPAAAFQSVEMQAVAHEEPREALGLALCAVWSGLLALTAWRGRDTAGARGRERPASDSAERG